jgi:hypothetical protein
MGFLPPDLQEYTFDPSATRYGTSFATILEAPCDHLTTACSHGFASYGAALVALEPRDAGDGPLLIDEAFFIRVLARADQSERESRLRVTQLSHEVLAEDLCFTNLADGGCGTYTGGSAPPSAGCEA